jgi:small-conductance mechanosensitive channel
MPDFDKKPWSTIVDLLRDDILPIVLILVVAIIAIRVARLSVRGLVKALLDREATEGTAQELSAVELKKRMDTLDSLGGRTLQAFIVAIAGLMVLGQVGLDIGPAIAGLGVVGIAVGFGAQSLVKDYLNGALILIENQFGKGDVIRAAGVAGAVEDFTLRRTTLRDLDGVVNPVPTGDIRVASNLTRVWSRIKQDVTVA